MFRAYILPVLLMGAVGGPMLYSHHKRHSTTAADGTVAQGALPPSTLPPWQAASYQQNVISNPNAASSGIPMPGPDGLVQVNRVTTSPSNIAQPSSTYLPASQPTGFPQPNDTNFAATPTMQPGQVIVNRPSGFQPNQNQFQQVATGPTATAPTAAGPTAAGPTAIAMTNDQAWAQPGMVPDFAKTETLVFRGDASGPDLTAAPMSFTPTIDLSSLFRFDVTKQWITSRWDRVSTCPADQGLHGMRVAVVTGTNSWDLHGSLTYYFDANHRVQRVTFRGWTGDASRLVQTLQQSHQLRATPTHWAGLYLSKRSGLLMKHPAVIDKNNPVQQLAIIMEINNPSGKTPLSNDFQSLLPAAMATQ